MMRATVVLLTLLFAVSGLAQETSTSGPSSFGFPSTLYVDVYGYFGMTTGDVQGQGETLSLNQQGASITVGALVSGFLLGLGTDYRQVNNSKDPATDIGSFKGTRWAPLVISTGYLGESFLLKLEYQPMGVFTLTQPTYQGSTVTYGEGTGYRASLMYNVWNKIMLGPQYESLTFPTRYDSQMGQADGETLTLTQIGLAGAYVF